MKITNAYLDEKRQECDALADEVVAKLFAENKFYAFNEVLKNTNRNGTINLDAFPDYLQDYFAQTSVLPIWADVALIKKGSLFFDKHAENIILMLSFLSLPYCYANSKGAGFISTQKVRLMHATIRYYIRKSGTWDVSTFGEPVNQEDLAMTHLSFCFVVLQGLRKIGISISKTDAEAYLHLWKVISYLMGVDINLLADDELAAYKLDKFIQQRHFEKSENGIFLTNALLTFLEESIAEAPNKNPLLTAKGFVPSYARFVLGDKLADLLAIAPANWTSNLLNILKLSNAFKNVFSFEKISQENGKILLQTIQKSEGKTDFALPERLS